MTFKKYSSIENHYRTAYTNNIIASGNTGGLWVVTEKVHGSNFGIHYDGEKITCQKRSSSLGDNSNFFNFQIPLAKYSQGIKDYCNHRMNDGVFKDVIGITIFGELCGGSYKGLESMHKKIQKEVDYSNEIEFIAFDVCFFYENNATFQNWSELEVLHTFDIPVVPVIRIGTFDECLAENCEFKSKVPEIFGMPEHPEENICEGIVIKPIIGKYLPNNERVIIKKKNGKFNEKTNVKIKKDVITPLTEEEKTVLSGILELISENRLRNVISKIGEITQKDFGELMRGMYEDIKEELDKDNKDLVKLLGHKKYKKIINTNLSGLIRKNFVNIIDGEF